MVGSRPPAESFTEPVDGESISKQATKQSSKKSRQRRKRKPGGSKESPEEIQIQKAVEVFKDGNHKDQKTVQKDQKDTTENFKDGKTVVLEGEASVVRTLSEGENGKDDDILEGETSVVRTLLEGVRLVEKNQLPLLCEEEVARNRQEQEDEVLALESIYEGRFRVLTSASEECEDRRFFVVEIPLEVDGGLEVSMRSSAASSSSEEPRYHSFKLEHLPPMSLAFTFPSTYPSRSPPVFILESTWLEAKKLSVLCDSLLQLWEDQRGEVVVYTWTDFLHTQALSSVGASEQLVLDFQEHDDPRVVSGATSLEQAAVSLLSYNEEMQQQSFLASFHTCEICFTEYVGKEFIQLPCRHAYCRTCLQEYSSIHVKEGTITRLKCPDLECARSIPPFVLKELLSDEEFERWDTMSLEKTEGVTYCPRCNTLCIPDDQHLAQCEKCFYSFCDICRETWHAGECMNSEARLKLLEQCGRAATAEQARKRADLVNQLKSLQYVASVSRPCPVCYMAISKSEGCNKMVCSNCGNKFCYKCGKKIDSYEHFRGGDCELFDEAAVRNWERNNNLLAHIANAQLGQLAQYPNLARTCPSCRQRSLKVNNNNHVFCVYCQNHFCGVCHKIVRKSSEHFGPNKCKQHTTD